MVRVEEILSRLIAMETVNPPGNEDMVAGYLESLFQAYSIPCSQLSAVPGRANLIARLGSGEPRLLFLSHSDVVPAGEGWDFEPFSGEISGGFVRGRGAIDCKNLVAAGAWVMMHLKEAQVPLKGTLILAVVADEEAGGEKGMGFLAREHPGEVAADLAINEGGEEAVIIGGKPVYFVQVGEKGILQVRLTTRGTSAHGSRPSMGDNALISMAGVVQRLAAYTPPPMVIPELAPLLQGLNSVAGLPATAVVEELTKAVDDRGLACYLEAVTRMTLSPGIMRSGTRVNVVPDKAELELDVRLLPGQEREEVMELVHRQAGDKVEIECLTYQEPTFSSTDTPGYRLVADNVSRITASPCLPCISTGATDSRYLRHMGIPAYGLSLLGAEVASELRPGMHGKNERIDIASLENYTKILSNIAMDFLRP